MDMPRLEADTALLAMSKTRRRRCIYRFRQSRGDRAPMRASTTESVSPRRGGARHDRSPTHPCPHRRYAECGAASTDSLRCTTDRRDGVQKGGCGAERRAVTPRSVHRPDAAARVSGGNMGLRGVSKANCGEAEVGVAFAAAPTVRDRLTSSRRWGTACQTRGRWPARP